MTPDLDAIVGDIIAMMAQADERGAVASYIPELAKVDPAQFGIAIATADGRAMPSIRSPNWSMSRGFRAIPSSMRGQSW